MADYNLKQIQNVPDDMQTKYKDMGDGTHAQQMYVGGMAPGGSGDIGATTDAEAAGNGSVIAILKRIRTLLMPQLAAAANTHEPAANTAAVLTKAAPGAGIHWVIAGLYWSYDATPTAGSLTVTDGGVQVFKLDVTDRGPGFVPFTPPMRFANNSQVVVTLAGAGAAVSGIVNAHAWME